MVIMIFVNFSLKTKVNNLYYFLKKKQYYITAFVNSQNNIGWTPLHKATDHGHTEVVKLILNEGGSVTIYDKWKRSVVDVANQKNQKQIIEIFNIKTMNPNHIFEISTEVNTKSTLQTSPSELHSSKKLEINLIIVY